MASQSFRKKTFLPVIRTKHISKRSFSEGISKSLVTADTLFNLMVSCVNNVRRVYILISWLWLKGLKETLIYYQAVCPPHWLVGLVTYEITSSVELDNVTLLQRRQFWVTQHLSLKLEQNTESILWNIHVYGLNVVS